MSLLKNIRLDILWFLSLYRKLTKIALLHTVVVVCLIAVANIALVLAFFLPLKTLFLAGSPAAPDYLNGIMEGYSKDSYIVVFTILAIFFYALHHFANGASAKIIRSGAERLVKKAQKITIFENQELLASSVYQKFCSILASLLFILVGSIVGLLIYSNLFIFFLFFSVLYLLTSVLVISYGLDGFRSKKRSALVEFYGGVGFLFLFAFVIFDYFYGYNFSALRSIVGLLLVRQIIQRTSSLFLESFYLIDNRSRINSLFYTALYFAPQSNIKDDEFWMLTASKNRNSWLADILLNLADPEITGVESKFVQLNTPNIVGFDVDAYSNNKEFIGEYTVKLFGPGRDVVCNHESSLLLEKWSKSLPAPVLIGMAKIGSFNCLVFKRISGMKPMPANLKINWYLALSETWRVEPSLTIMDQFSRSKPLLADRLDDGVITRLHLTLNTAEEFNAVNQFGARIHDIKSAIRSLPLFIMNPDLNMSTILEKNNKELVVSNWSRWAVEPIGAGWPTSCQDINAIDDYLHNAAKNRAELKSVSPELVKLTALVYAFESQFSRQNYISAIEFIPQILGALESASASSLHN